MPQFFPDGPATVSLNAIQESGGLNLPSEGSFSAPGLQGSMQQILSENLGKFVIADFLVGVGTMVRRVGILYSVAQGYVTLYLSQYQAFEVCDVYSLKFVTFFQPGSEPSIDELNQGLANSGILVPGGFERAFGSGMYTGAGIGLGTLGNSSPGAGGGSQNMGGRGNSGNSMGCRSLGQR